MASSKSVDTSSDIRVKASSLNAIMIINYTDSKVHGANMGPIWGRQDPGGPMLAPWTLLSG